MLRVTVERIDESGEVVDQKEALLKNLILLGEYEGEDERLTELGCNVSISLVAQMILTGHMTSKALILANAMKKIRETETAESESSLLDAILGGMGNGTDS